MLFEKDKENDSYSPFRSLPMQAALGLYLPHDEECSNPFSKTKPTSRPQLFFIQYYFLFKKKGSACPKG